MTVVEDRSQSFRDFARDAEPKLRYALVAGHGADRGLEALNDALVHGWQHWDRVRTMDNPIGYLYRVGQSKARRRRKRMPNLEEQHEHRAPWIEPGLSRALDTLSRRQREVIVLVGAFEYTQREAADVLGITPSSVRTHLDRAMQVLRRELGVTDV